MNIENLTADQSLEKYNSFEMFSKAGDKSCKSLVKKVFRRIGGKYRMTQDDVTVMITEECKKIQKKHPEVYDTEPGCHIQELVNKKLQEIGYCFEVSRYDF
jgi:hypothetical protein